LRTGPRVIFFGLRDARQKDTGENCPHHTLHFSFNIYSNYYNRENELGFSWKIKEIKGFSQKGEGKMPLGNLVVAGKLKLTF
jgi:hypothetical protein